MKVNYFVKDLNDYLELQKIKNEVFLTVERDYCEGVISPCGKYKLDLYKYLTQKGRWNYTEGVITRLKDNKELCSIKRNYSCFYYKWINNYFICGENYQGYSVIDLDKEEQSIYFPEEGFKGGGFCWASIYGVANNKLVVEGCYWGGSYEVVVYDFSNPSVLPLPELERFDVDGHVKLDGNTLTIEQELEYRLSDDAFYNDLSDKEQKILDDNFPKLSAFKIVVITRTI